MYKYTTFAIASLLVGCASVTPNYDMRFGEALRDAKLKMMINPQAGKTEDSASGIDGRAAKETASVYLGTFKAPPPAVNVINIGGGIGSK